MQSTIVSCCIRRITVPRTCPVEHGQGALLHLALEPVRATGGPRIQIRPTLHTGQRLSTEPYPRARRISWTSSPSTRSTPPEIDLRGCSLVLVAARNDLLDISLFYEVHDGSDKFRDDMPILFERATHEVRTERA